MKAKDGGARGKDQSRQGAAKAKGDADAPRPQGPPEAGPLDRVTFLESQVSLRERELTLMRSELSERERIIRDLGEPHLMRERQLSGEVGQLRTELTETAIKLAEMTQELEQAIEGIQVVEAQNDQLQTQLDECRNRLAKAEREFSLNAAHRRFWHRAQLLMLVVFATSAGLALYQFSDVLRAPGTGAGAAREGATPAGSGDPGSDAGVSLRSRAGAARDPAGSQDKEKGKGKPVSTLQTPDGRTKQTGKPDTAGNDASAQGQTSADRGAPSAGNATPSVGDAQRALGSAGGPPDTPAYGAAGAGTPALPQGSGAGETAPGTNAGSGNALLLPRSAAGSAGGAAETITATDDRELGAEDWQGVIRLVETNVFKNGAPAVKVVSTAYGPGDRPVAIVRGEFSDIFTRRPPKGLPAQAEPDGLLLHHLSPSTLDVREFSRELGETRVQHGSLCQKEPFAPQQHRRVTLLVSNTPGALECVNRFLGSLRRPDNWFELSVVILSREPRFSASLSDGAARASLQQWHPDWLTGLTADWETDLTLAEGVVRARRLAAIARALGKSSDVQVEVDSREGALRFGNLAIFPFALAVGSVRVTRVSLSTGEATGRSAETKLEKSTKAIVILGGGKGLQLVTEKGH